MVIMVLSVTVFEPTRQGKYEPFPPVLLRSFNPGPLRSHKAMIGFGVDNAPGTFSPLLYKEADRKRPSSDVRSGGYVSSPVQNIFRRCGTLVRYFHIAFSHRWRSQ